MQGDRDGLAGWSFEVEEVSPGAYRVRGIDQSGHGVESKGTDPDTVLEECKQKALWVTRELQPGSGLKADA